MRFPNAYKGISKIYLAELLVIIAAIATAIASVLAGIAVGIGNEEDATVIALIGGAGIIVLVAGILFIIAFIVNVVGVNDASKDELKFKHALYAIIVNIVVTIIGLFLTGIANDICDLVGEIAGIVTTIFIIQGIMALGNKIGSEDLVNRGKFLLKLIVAIWVITFVLTILSGFVLGETAAVVAGILSIVASVLSIVQYIAYLIYLSRAKKALAE